MNFFYYQKYVKYKDKYLTLQKRGVDIMSHLYQLEEILMEIFIYFRRCIRDNRIAYEKVNGELKYIVEPVRNLGNVADILCVLHLYPQMGEEIIRITSLKTLNYYSHMRLNCGADAFLLIGMIFYDRIYPPVFSEMIEMKKDNLMQLISKGLLRCEDQDFFAGEVLHSLNIYEKYVGELSYDRNSVLIAYADFFAKKYVGQKNDLLPFFTNWQLQAFLGENHYTRSLIEEITGYLQEAKIDNLVTYACALEGLSLHLDLEQLWMSYGGYVEDIISLYHEGKQREYNNLRLDELGHAMMLSLHILEKNRRELWLLKDIPRLLVQQTEKVIFPPSPEISRYTREGVFVTIYENGELAGCIGSFYGDQEESLASKIGKYTDYSMKDPRFQHGVTYYRGRTGIHTTTTILGPVKIHSLDVVNKYYIPRYHGIILYCDNQIVSTYLPVVMAEQNWIRDTILDKEAVVSSLKNKGGIRDCPDITIGLYPGYEIDDRISLPD